MDAVVDLGLVELVGDQPQPAPPAQTGQRRQPVGLVDRPGGVVRRVDQDRAGIRLQRPLDRADIGLETLIGRGLDQDRPPRGGAHGLGEGGVERVEHDAGLPRVEHRRQAGEQRRLPARGDDDVLAGSTGSGPRRHPPGDGVAQRVRAHHAGIAQIAAIHARLHGVEDAGVGLDVVVADGQHHHRRARRLDRPGAVMDRPAVVGAADHRKDPPREFHRLPPTGRTAPEGRPLRFDSAENSPSRETGGGATGVRASSTLMESGWMLSFPGLSNFRVAK